jgi:hypothetical protein
MEITNFGRECRGRYGRDEKEQARRLADALVTVAHYLCNRRDYTPDGSLLEIYQNNKIHIEVNTFAPTLSVRIYLRGHLTQVYTRFHSSSASTYRPGKWETYVMEQLLPQARRREMLERKAKQMKERVAEEEKFTPIADDEVFSEFEQTKG